jgi:hypothetical protein
MKVDYMCIFSYALARPRELVETQLWERRRCALPHRRRRITLRKGRGPVCAVGRRGTVHDVWSVATFQ